MKIVKKIWAPVLIAVILAIFGGIVYYNNVVVPNKAFGDKAGVSTKDLDDYITLGDYKGLECEVTQQEIDDCINEEIQYYDEVKRAAQEGDCIEINYTGYIDGIKDANISEKNCELYIGQETELYEEFTNAVIGKNAGDTVEITSDNANYVAEDDTDYTCKQATFKVKLISVSEKKIETVTDEWVKENYFDDYGLETAKDFYTWNEDYVLDDKKTTLWQMVLDNATMNGYPQDTYTDVKDEFDADAAYYADMYGMTVDDYLTNFCGYTDESLEEEYLNEVKSELVMWKIVQEEKLEATDEDLEDKYEELYEDCGYDSVEEMKKDYTDAEIEEAVLLDKAMDVVLDNATITKSYTLPQ